MKYEDFISNQDKQLDKNIEINVNKVKDKQNYLVLSLDNDEKLTISIDNYFKYKINLNKGLSIKDFQFLKKEENELITYNSILRKLSIKDYSVYQIREYLNKKRIFNDNQIDIIIGQLINNGLLNDERYAENRFNYLNSLNNSIKQIKFKLIKEGISETLVSKYCVSNNETEKYKCDLLANKYLKTINNKSLNATKQSILNKLINNGFNYEIAKESVDSLNYNNNDASLIKKEYAKALLKYSKKYKDYELKNKIYSYLLSKGFSLKTIKEVENV